LINYYNDIWEIVTFAVADALANDQTPPTKLDYVLGAFYMKDLGVSGEWFQSKCPKACTKESKSNKTTL